jgi:hypothetical protein
MVTSLVDHEAVLILRDSECVSAQSCAVAALAIAVASCRCSTGTIRLFLLSGYQEGGLLLVITFPGTCTVVAGVFPISPLFPTQPRSHVAQRT